MARKILAWILILLGGLFLVLSVAGIFAVWIYNEPLTQRVTAQLSDIDGQLAQAKSTLKNSELELARALRILDGAQTTLEKLTRQTSSAANLFDNIQNTLDGQLLPELKTTRNRIQSARNTLVSLQSVLSGVANFIPGVDLSAPGKVVSGSDRLHQIPGHGNRKRGVGGAAGFDIRKRYLLSAGRRSAGTWSLQSFLTSIHEYQKKVADWQQQTSYLKQNAPKWIDQASIALTIFLLWFAISQFGLLLHGLNMLEGPIRFWHLREPTL